jgi:hypothetical protein
MKQNDSANPQAIQTRELYQGPIPHPERIMKMAEENNRNTTAGLPLLSSLLSVIYESKVWEWISR